MLVAVLLTTLRLAASTGDLFACFENDLVILHVVELVVSVTR